MKNNGDLPKGLNSEVCVGNKNRAIRRRRRNTCQTAQKTMHYCGKAEVSVNKSKISAGSQTLGEINCRTGTVASISTHCSTTKDRGEREVVLHCTSSMHLLILKPRKRWEADLSKVSGGGHSKEKNGDIKAGIYYRQKHQEEEDKKHPKDRT